MSSDFGGGYRQGIHGFSSCQPFPVQFIQPADENWICHSSSSLFSLFFLLIIIITSMENVGRDFPAQLLIKGLIELPPIHPIECVDNNSKLWMWFPFPVAAASVVVSPPLVGVLNLFGFRIQTLCQFDIIHGKA